MEKAGIEDFKERKRMDDLIRHYNKFNEDKRLTRRHGRVEYLTTMHYIHKYLDEIKANAKSNQDIRILDIGAGTGKYCVALSEEGYDVSAVEYVKYNLGILKQKKSNVKAFQGDARKLKRFEDNAFDMTLLFGPMYHLYTQEDKIQALCEARRVTKAGGYVLVAYLMNEYGVLTYGFKEQKVFECLEDGRLDERFHCHSKEKDLYDYVRLEDINQLNEHTNMERVQIISADGPADYMRRELNAMSEEMFQKFVEYHLSVCERPELLGAGAHTVDILKK